MIRKAIDALSMRLSAGLALSNSRLETLCLLVIGIASVRTVNLSHICGEMPTQAKVESTYRRLQRFFQFVDLEQDWSARLVVRMLGLTGSWKPANRAGRARNGLGRKDRIRKTWSTKAPTEISRTLREIHLPHWAR